jgi:lysophospholipase L1-like esterase
VGHQSSSGYVLNWAGGFLLFTCTPIYRYPCKHLPGTAVNIYVSIDGGADVFYAGVKGTVSLTSTALASGTHTLRVEYRSGDCVFKGLTGFDSGAGTVNPNLTTKLVEFVGDSITAGYLTTKLAEAHGSVLGEGRHTQVARPATADRGPPSGRAAGSSTGRGTSDFSKYQASAVVINLGTNDIGYGVTSSQFQATYTTFLANIQAKYPSAAIFVMETFKQRYVTETKAAVAARNSAGDSKVTFINTEGWIDTTTDTTTDTNDGTHPNIAGHIRSPTSSVISSAAVGRPNPAPHQGRQATSRRPCWKAAPEKSTQVTSVLICQATRLSGAKIVEGGLP